MGTLGLELASGRAACNRHAPSALPAGRLNGLKHPAHQLGLTCNGAQPAQQDTASCARAFFFAHLFLGRRPEISSSPGIPGLHLSAYIFSPLQLAEFICISHWGIIVRLHATVAALREVNVCSHLVGTEQCTLKIAGLQAEFGAPAEQGICFLIPSRLQAEEEIKVSSQQL